ncbi:hypothetical protein TUZN_0864 [Thermoproteus uzoniensis 768-20]|uniref:ABC-2 type transport system permease protein n=1 Tax=Thermoproteus uzoniensis (strain 768-20) TaxID=999630 RepID=F2L5H8_THEU7|nr:hypothetical protein [Thermoproteus uzoniensis]AEA12349.1 hypothetical protein TUZN_0864 [Thermoproteus uzoniensis 768-20]
MSRPGGRWRRAWRKYYLYFKQSAGRGSIASIVFLVALAVFVYRGGAGIGPAAAVQLLGFLMALAALSSAIGGRFVVSKSEIDFYFAAPISPWEYLLMRAAVMGLGFALVLASFTFSFTTLSNAPWYALALLANSASLALAVAGAPLLPWKARSLYLAYFAAAAALSFVDPPLSPLYGLVEPSPIYAAYSAALAAAMAVVMPRKYVEELATNAYGLFGRPSELMPPYPRRMAEAVMMGRPKLGRTPWEVVWATTALGARVKTVKTPYGSVEVLQRINALKLGVYISAATAALYYAATLFINDEIGLAIAAGFVYYIIQFLIASFSIGAVAGERLWLSLSADPYAYFRYRSLARAASAAAVLAPWIAAYAVQSLRFGPSLYLAAGLASAVFLYPLVGWIAAAYIGVPQIRELGLPQRQQTLSLKATLIGAAGLAYVAATMAPFAMAVAASGLPQLSAALLLAADVWTGALLALSAASLAVAVAAGAPLWNWVADKLAEEGYV